MRKQLRAAERQLDAKGIGAAPFAMQPLLKRTYENEMRCIKQQKKDVNHEVDELREIVEKMRRKQSSVISQFRIAHGTEGEEVENRMSSLK